MIPKEKRARLLLRYTVGRNPHETDVRRFLGCMHEEKIKGWHICMYYLACTTLRTLRSIEESLELM